MIFEFRRCDNFTGDGFFLRLLLLALEAKQVTHFSFTCRLGNVANHVRSDFPDMTRMIESLPANGSIHGFEHIGRKRGVGSAARISLSFL